MIRRTAMYNTPQIRNGGFGALQVEALTNRPASIARRHLAASQLRMHDIEPDELDSSQWVRFLVMEERERDRWMLDFLRRRRDSASSSSSVGSVEASALTMRGRDKAEEARRESEMAQAEERREWEIAIAAADAADHSAGSSSSAPSGSAAVVGTTPAVSVWARSFDGREEYDMRRPVHSRRAVGADAIEAPPTYESLVRSADPPPAYEPRSDDESDLPQSPQY